MKNITVEKESAEWVSLSVETMNQLWITLAVSTVCILIGGNLLLLNRLTFIHSSMIAASCFALLAIFYVFSRKIGDFVWGIVLTYGLMVILVYSRLPWLVFMFYGAAVGSLVYIFLLFWYSCHDWRAIFLMAVVATVTILGMEAYTSFDMLQRLYVGEVCQDTLFHASIAAMIKNYGVSSTGLHGLVEVPYHTFSHVLMASISLISGVGVVEVYGVANHVLFAPFLIFSITAFCTITSRANHISIPLLWGISSLLLATISFLFWRWVIQRTFFISESYVVSLALFVLGSTLLYKKSLSLRDLLLLFFVSFMISNAKASVGLIFSGLWFVRLLFLRKRCEKTRQIALASILVVIAAGFAVFNSAHAAPTGITFSPLHLIKNYSFLGKYLDDVANAVIERKIVSLQEIIIALFALFSFFAFHFFVPIATILYDLYTKRTLKNSMTVYSLAALFTGVLIILTAGIAGGSAYYFSNVAMFVSLPRLVIILSEFINRKNIHPVNFLLMVIALICIMQYSGFSRNSIFWHGQYAAGTNNLLIDRLMALNKNKKPDVVFKPSINILAMNPVARCTAKPFLFPAVSERPWIGVIDENSENCNYIYYGYEQYGITQEQQSIKVHPVFLSGMVIKNID
jgi:hypothetical protein